jgi:hypothetical protein
MAEKCRKKRKGALPATSAHKTKKGWGRPENAAVKFVVFSPPHGYASPRTRISSSPQHGTPSSRKQEGEEMMHPVEKRTEIGTEKKAESETESSQHSLVRTPSRAWAPSRSHSRQRARENGRKNGRRQSEIREACEARLIACLIFSRIGKKGRQKTKTGVRAARKKSIRE